MASWLSLGTVDIGVGNLFVWKYFTVFSSTSCLYPLDAPSTHHSLLWQLEMSPDFAIYAGKTKLSQRRMTAPDENVPFSQKYNSYSLLCPF